MKKIALSGLKQASKRLTEQALDARAVYDEWQAKVKELDGPKAKRDYTPVRLAELRNEARNATLNILRKVQAEMRITLEPARGQRSRWTKAALLREQRFAIIPKDLSWLADDRNYAASVEHLAATRELSALIRAGRLDDESLVESLEEAIEAEDLPLAGVLATEAGNRKAGGEMYKLKVSQALKKLDFPELTEAEKAFGEIERAADEVALLETALENPYSDWAQGRVSFFPAQRKIEERQAAEAAAAEAAKKAEKEAPPPVAA